MQIKIDRAFVGDLAHDGVSRGLVTAILDISRLLGLQTVAEGVETAEQSAVLRELGVELQQGVAARAAGARRPRLSVTTERHG